MISNLIMINFCEQWWFLLPRPHPCPSTIPVMLKSAQRCRNLNYNSLKEFKSYLFFGSTPRAWTLSSWKQADQEDITSMDQWFGRLWQPTNLQMGGISKIVKCSAFFDRARPKKNNLSRFSNTFQDLGNCNMTSASTVYTCLKICLAGGFWLPSMSNPQPASGSAGGIHTCTNMKHLGVGKRIMSCSVFNSMFFPEEHYYPYSKEV